MVRLGLLTLLLATAAGGRLIVLNGNHELIT